jgi:hypothetical protein
MLLKPSLGTLTLEQTLAEDRRLQDERERRKLLDYTECASVKLRPEVLVEVASVKPARPWNPGEKERS